MKHKTIVDIGKFMWCSIETQAAAERTHRQAVAAKPLNLLEFYLSSPTKRHRDDFVSTLDAARWCGVTQRTVENWIDAGHVGAVRIGWKYLVFRPTLKTYLEGLAG